MIAEKNKKQPLGAEASEKVTVGVGWNKRRSDGPSHDLDTSILLLSSDNQCHEPQDLCFYKDGHRTVHGGAVIHYGDEKVGALEGDDERIDINFSLIPHHIQKIIIAVSIHQAVARGLNFGQVDGAYVRILGSNGKELVAYDLSEDASSATAVEFCEITRTSSGWDFEAVERGNSRGLAGIISKYGFTPK